MRTPAVSIQLGGDDLARLRQLLPALRKGSGANCSVSSAMRL
jgi:hypothetical protein